MPRLLPALTLLGLLLAIPALASPNQEAPDDSSKSQAPVKQIKNAKKPPPETPAFPGSQVIWIKPKMKAEIRPDKSVWWYGVNQKKAIVADGTHELADGQKITTKRGKLVGKHPKPMTEPVPQKKPVP